MRRAIFGKRVMQITVFLLVGLMISGGFSSMISASPSYPVHPVDSNKRAVTVRTPSSEVNECDQSIKLKFSFSSPQIKHVGDYDEITMQELYNLNEPGMPVLPFKTVKILLPPNSSLKNISVIPENKITLDGFFNIKLGQKPVPIPYIQAKNISDNFGGMDAYPQSMNKTRVCTDIKNQQNQQHCKQDPYQIQSINSSTLSFNQTVFDSAEIFPPELYSMGGIYQFRGYQILLVNLNPAQYVAKTGTVSYFETMNMYITTDDWSSKNYNLPENFRSLPQDIDRVKDIVDNPSMIDTYNTFRNELSKSSYDYVIITNENLASSFQPLADWKNQKEVATTIVTVENITSNPDYWNTTNSLFNDTQAQIRSFIKYAYNNWE